MKYAKKLSYQFLLTMKASILDTHGITILYSLLTTAIPKAFEEAGTDR
jgi:hypothetical protein